MLRPLWQFLANKRKERKVLKKKIDKKIIIIIVLLIILIGIIIAYVSDDSSSTKSSQTESIWTKTESTTSEEDTTTTISTTGEISSALEESIELHATYYFEKIYVSENEYVEQGEKIVEYTNGTYLVAPYDCVVTGINVPEAEEKCTNQHSITIKSTNMLQMSLSIDETQIDKIQIGQEASLYVSTIGKTYTGYITKISSTASNGRFTAIAEFENDGDIKIGMTGKCSINVI